MAIIQRFGGALNLNVHIHALVADGVFVRERGRVRFRRTPPVAPGKLALLLAVIARRVQRLLVRRGVWDVDEGVSADPRVRAGTAAPVDGRDVASNLRSRRVARAFGGLGAAAADQFGAVLRRLRPAGGGPAGDCAARDAPVDGGAPDRARSSNANWAGLMQRSFGFDVLACPRCPGWLRLVALIHQAAVVRRILTHLGLPSDQPVLRPSRDSPEAVWVEPP